MYIYIYICIHTYIHKCIRAYVYSCTHTHTQDRGKTRKIDSYVNFPMELDLKPFCHREAPKESVNNSVYDLFGAVVHSGSLNSGHYVAYVSDLGAGPNRVWRYFSDAQVKVCMLFVYVVSWRVRILVACPRCATPHLGKCVQVCILRSILMCKEPESVFKRQSNARSGVSNIQARLTGHV
jgi:hypothetical protein